MEAAGNTDRTAQQMLPECSSYQERAMVFDAVARMGAANVAHAAADVDLSLTFCAITDARPTREDLIRKAAYLHAEARRFEPGGEAEDWFCAEQQVDHWIGIYGLPDQSRAPGPLKPECELVGHTPILDRA